MVRRPSGCGWGRYRCRLCESPAGRARDDVVCRPPPSVSAWYHRRSAIGAAGSGFRQAAADGTILGLYHGTYPPRVRPARLAGPGASGHLADPLPRARIGRDDALLAPSMAARRLAERAHDRAPHRVCGTANDIGWAFARQPVQPKGPPRGYRHASRSLAAAEGKGETSLKIGALQICRYMSNRRQTETIQFRDYPLCILLIAASNSCKR